MPYKIAIRGVPNFTYLQYIEVEKLEDLFSLFDVRAHDLSWAGFIGELFNRGGKRVSLYLSPESVGFWAGWTTHRGIRPSKLDPARIESFGGGGLPGVWHEVNPKLWPTYPAAQEAAKKKRQEAARRLQEAEEREEALQAAIDSIIDSKGHAAVLQALKDAGLAA